jgi:hypothetical protein
VPATSDEVGVEVQTDVLKYYSIVIIELGNNTVSHMLVVVWCEEDTRWLYMEMTHFELGPLAECSKDTDYKKPLL